MRTILITRTLTDQSPIQVLQSENIKVIGESFLNFEQIEFDSWDTDSDLVLFYSQRGVEYSFLNTDFKDYCKTILTATFGPATSDFLDTHHNIKTNIVGDGGIDSIISQIKINNPSKVLFVQGEQSLKRLQSLDTWDFDYTEVVPYRSIDRPVLLSNPADILVFTSPLNVVHYCNQYIIEPSQTLWAIGPTTASAIKERTDHPIHLPIKPTEASLTVDILRSLS